MKQKTTRSQDRKELRPAAPAVGSRMLPATKFYNICARKDEQRDISRFLQHTSDTDSNTTTPGAHISLVAAILIAMMGSAAATHLSSNTERQATISDRRALVENFFRGTISEEGHCFRSYVKGLLAMRDASKGRDGTEGRPFNMPNLVLQLLPRTSSFASNPGLRRVCEVLIHDAEVAIRVDGSNGISKNWSEEEDQVHPEAHRGQQQMVEEVLQNKGSMELLEDATGVEAATPATNSITTVDSLSTTRAPHRPAAEEQDCSSSIQLHHEQEVGRLEDASVVEKKEPSTAKVLAGVSTSDPKHVQRSSNGVSTGDIEVGVQSVYPKQQEEQSQLQATKKGKPNDVRHAKKLGREERKRRAELRGQEMRERHAKTIARIRAQRVALKQLVEDGRRAEEQQQQQKQQQQQQQQQQDEGQLMEASMTDSKSTTTPSKVDVTAERQPSRGRSSSAADRTERPSGLPPIAAPPCHRKYGANDSQPTTSRSASTHQNRASLRKSLAVSAPSSTPRAMLSPKQAPPYAQSSTSYTPLGSLFIPALSLVRVISLVREVVPSSKAERIVRAIRLGRVDATHFFWLLRGFTSPAAAELLKDTEVRYVGPRPPSLTSSFTGSPEFYSRRGITCLLNTIASNSCAGDKFVLCFSNGLDTCAQLLTGKLSTLDNSVISDDNKSNLIRGEDSYATPHVPLIFGESCERAGRPAIERDDVGGTGARIMSVSDWVGVYGECAESLLCAWVYGGK